MEQRLSLSVLSLELAVHPCLWAIHERHAAELRRARPNVVPEEGPQLHVPYLACDGVPHQHPYTWKI